MSLVNIPRALKDGLLRVVSYVPGVTSKQLREQLESCIIRPREPDKADIILAEYRAQINSTPALLSLLYDTNMLPEQTVTVHGAICVAAICEAYKAGAEPGVRYKAALEDIKSRKQTCASDEVEAWELQDIAEQAIKT